MTLAPIWDGVIPSICLQVDSKRGLVLVDDLLHQLAKDLGGFFKLQLASTDDHSSVRTEADFFLVYRQESL